MSDVFHVILAGGGGTRLWPLSTSLRPKQFVSIQKGTDTMLDATCKRLKGSGEPEGHFILSTNTVYYDQVEAIAKNHGVSHIIQEPAKKDTAAAQALAIHYAQKKAGAKDSDVIVFSNSDHVISPEKDFLDCLYKGIEEARKSEGLVIYGIKPTRPDTGYGYIEVEDLEEGIHEVTAFREKPNVHTAMDYLESGNYLWNSGIYVGAIGEYKRQFKQYCPGISVIFDLSYEEAYKQFDSLPELPVDIAISEKSDSIRCVTMDVNWSDVGSWDRICEVRDGDENDNIIEGFAHTVESSNNLVWNDNPEKLVVLDGVSDLVVVDTGDSIMISKKGREPFIKTRLKELRKSGYKGYL